MSKKPTFEIKKSKPRKKRSVYPPKFIMQVLIEIKSEGKISKTAAKYNIAPNILYKWKANGLVHYKKLEKQGKMTYRNRYRLKKKK